MTGLLLTEDYLSQPNFINFELIEQKERKQIMVMIATYFVTYMAKGTVKRAFKGPPRIHDL
jgi:hypothetical protein